MDKGSRLLIGVLLTTMLFVLGGVWLSQGRTVPGAILLTVGALRLAVLLWMNWPKKG